MHRLQHEPARARHGKRHTSAATVTVLADPPAVAAAGLRELDLRIETMRGRGRGGQRKNKVETAVRLTHLPSGTTITRTTGRSQAANLTSARDELERVLRTRAAQQAAAETARQRRVQAARQNRGGAFSHDAVRGRVTDQTTGQSWSLRAWRQGRFDRPAARAGLPPAGQAGS